MTTRSGVGLVLLALAGCSAGLYFLGSGRDRREIPFTHRTHAKQELPCEICHETAETEDAAGMPTKETCVTCHEPAEGREPKDFERRILEAVELRFPRWNRSPDVIFSHRVHAERGIACETCHGKIEETEALDEGVVARMDACTACHARERAPNECESCHREIRLDVRPKSHDLAFLRLHGRDLRGSRDAAEAGRCATCHAPSSPNSCDGCHAERPPGDHTEFWRRRAHGFAAEVDRERCAACHREDSCLRCHLEVRPSSHAGAWGGSFSSHCFSCHEPLAANPCAACHKATPSHLQAPPLPPFPHPGPGVNCYTCHAVVPHADNMTTPCTACHQ